MNEFIVIFKRVTRVSATLFLLALLGCLIGYFVFRVSLDQLAVAVAVPVFWLFAISRILVLSLPDIAVKAEQAPPTKKDVKLIVTIASLITVFLSAVAAIDFLLSGVTFIYLRLHDLSYGAFRIAGDLGLLCVVIAFVFCIVIVRKHVSARANALIAGTWEVLRLPRRVADGLRYLPKVDQHQH